MAIIHAEQNQFTSLVSSGVTLVNFWAPWCGPCKMFAPTLEQLADTTDLDVKVVKVNVDELGDIAAEHQIMSIPTSIIFKDGQPVEKVMGAQPLNALEETIRKHI